jgi:hypothetical protein
LIATRKIKSTILEAVGETAKGLHAAGMMERVTLLEFTVCVCRRSSHCRGQDEED